MMSSCSSISTLLYLRVAGNAWRSNHDYVLFGQEFFFQQEVTKEAEKAATIISEQSVENEKEEEAPTEKQLKSLKETGKKG